MTASVSPKPHTHPKGNLRDKSEVFLRSGKKPNCVAGYAGRMVKGTKVYRTQRLKGGICAWNTSRPRNSR